jgi:hypothetical protein
VDPTFGRRTNDILLSITATARAPEGPVEHFDGAFDNPLHAHDERRRHAHPKRRGTAGLDVQVGIFQHPALVTAERLGHDARPAEGLAGGGACPHRGEPRLKPTGVLVRRASLPFGEVRQFNGRAVSVAHLKVQRVALERRKQAVELLI